MKTSISISIAIVAMASFMVMTSGRALAAAYLAPGVQIGEVSVSPATVPGVSTPAKSADRIDLQVKNIASPRPGGATGDGRSGSNWMNHGPWKSNRKIFLNPENWIDAQARNMCSTTAGGQDAEGVFCQFCFKAAGVRPVH